jgi:polysaccharide deacetylase family protein (PEP-CTERM system associated)
MSAVVRGAHDRRRIAPVNVFSVDVEDWFQAEVYAKTIPRAEWPRLPLRVHKTTRELLDLLAKRRVRATFFVLGTIADRAPELVRDIASGGHEIASHGWSHRPIWTMSRAEFRDEIISSRQLLQSISGQSVIGYRAPTFSVTKLTLWALEELSLAGYQYDSSIFPIRHDRYGISDAPLAIHGRESGLWEIPLSVLKIGSARLPFGGGGYLRLYPLKLTRFAIRRLNLSGRPTVVYVHPWELDIEQPRPPLAWLARFRHSVNIEKNAAKLGVLLEEFRFGTCADALSVAGMSRSALEPR